MENLKFNIEDNYRSLLLIWAALLVSQLLFLVVLYFVMPALFQFDFAKPFFDKNAIIIVIFIIAAIANLTMSFALRRKYIAQAVGEKNPALVQTAVIIGCALCESVSLFGLMLAFVAEYQYFLVWFVLGIIGIIFHFPRRADLQAAV